MDQLCAQIPSSGLLAIRRFRRAHRAALLINLLQLALLVWVLTQFSL